MDSSSQAVILFKLACILCTYSILMVKVVLPVDPTVVKNHASSTAPVDRTVVDGKPVSGRVWKKKQVRVSNRKSASSRKSLWEQKVLAKEKFKQMKEFEKEVIGRQQGIIQARAEKTKEKRKRRAEAELVNSRYQILTNDRKIKNMSKKQLRQVKRMRMNAHLGVVEFVGAYSK